MMDVVFQTATHFSEWKKCVVRKDGFWPSVRFVDYEPIDVQVMECIKRGIDYGVMDFEIVEGKRTFLMSMVYCGIFIASS